MTATYAYAIALFLLLAVLALSAYVDRIYFEMGKFLSREYQDNIDSWEQVVEPRLRLGRESIALSASVLRQLTLATLALLAGLRLYTHSTLIPSLARTPSTSEVVRAACELIILILIFDRLLPQLLFSRTRGLWIARILPVLQALFYLILPVTMLLQLLLSIAALAEPEDPHRRWTIPPRPWMRSSKLAKKKASSKSPTASSSAPPSNSAIRSSSRS